MYVYTHTRSQQPYEALGSWGSSYKHQLTKCRTCLSPARTVLRGFVFCHLCSDIHYADLVG